MFLVPRRHAWTQQPQDHVGIDPLNQFSRKIRAAFTANFDAVTGAGSVNVGGVFSPSQIGIGNTFSGSGYLQFAKVAYVPPPFTIVFVLNKSSKAIETLVSFGGVSGGTGWQIKTGGTATSCRVTYGGVADYTAITSFFEVGVDAVYAVSVSASTARFFRDGKFIGSSAVGTPSATKPTRPLTLGAAYDGAFYTSYSTSTIYGGVLLAEALPDGDVARLSANPWQVFEPKESRIFVPASAGGGTSTDLIVDDGLHGHAGGAIVLSCESLLSVSDSTHGHAADNLTLGLTGSTDLTVADSAHSHVADNIALSWSALLVVADGAHGHVADNATLDTSNAAQLTIQDATHAHLADSVTTSGDSWLFVSDAAHAHSADSLTVGSALTDAEKIDLILDILSNRQTIDPLTGVYTLYADDGVTVMKTAAAWEDAAGTIPYRGQGLQRLDAMQ